ncbi:MAG: NUDIX domain-containing protein [Planctomycetales bacterium]|nr:NUDIX domain-containing protein [Planctomycetales bacterium]
MNQADNTVSTDVRVWRVERATLLDRAWIVALRCAYRLMRGYWFIARPRTYGAYVAIWWDERLLLIRNSYKREQTFPAGGAKRQENLRETARREVREEIGIELADDQLQSAGMFLSLAEHKFDYCEVFEVRLDKCPDIRLDGREVVEAEFVAVNSLLTRKLTRIVQLYLQECHRGEVDDQGFAENAN